MNYTEFAVSRFENRNGDITWRVSGILHGIRICNNFKTREEAAAEKAALESMDEQATSGLRTVTTCLTTEQVREAEAVLRRLMDQSHSIAFCVNYTLANYRAPTREKLLTDAVGEYLAKKKREAERGIISEVQVGSITKELALLQGHFSGNTVGFLLRRN